MSAMINQKNELYTEYIDNEYFYDKWLSSAGIPSKPANNIENAMLQELYKLQVKPEDIQVEIKFILGQLMMKNNTTMIFSRAGQGKSLFVLALSLQLLREKLMKSIIYLDMDNPLVSLRMRKIDAIIEREPDLHYFNPAANKESSSTNMMDKLLKMAKEDPKVFEDTLIVFDSIRNFSLGKNSNKSSVVGPLMQKIQEIREAGATVIFLHHANRESNGTAFKGASDYEDAIDTSLVLSSKKVNDKLVVTVANDKNRNAPGGSMSFEIDVDTMTLRDVNSSLVAMKDENRELAKKFQAILKYNKEGMNQTELLNAAGTNKDDKTARNVLTTYVGELWERKKLKNNNASLYYPLPNLPKLPHSL